MHPGSVYLHERMMGMKATCSIPGCDEPSKCRGWCNTHYCRWFHTGDPQTPSRRGLPRDYPPEIVERVRELYESGMTMAEVDKAIGPGFQAQNIMRRYGIQSRSRAVRDQWGEKHHNWAGDEADYGSLHARVYRRRGNAKECEWCGENDPGVYYHWANLTGQYANVDDYARLCVTCHRRYDNARRAETGKNTFVGTKWDR